MYEHMKVGEPKSSRSTERSKAIAAATVLRHANKRDHPSESSHWMANRRRAELNTS